MPNESDPNQKEETPPQKGATEEKEKNEQPESSTTEDEKAEKGKGDESTPPKEDKRKQQKSSNNDNNSPRHTTVPECSERLERLAQPRKPPAAKAQPTPEEESSTPRRKVSGCSDRLAGTQKKEAKPLPPLVNSRRLQEGELEKQIDSLYAAPLARRAKWQEQQAEKYGNHTATSSTRSMEDVSQKVDFLAVASVDQRKKAMEALNKKYLKSPSRRRLEKTEQQESVNRLYNAALEHQKETNLKLERTYTPQRTSRKMGPGQLSESAKRLSSPRDK